MLRVTAGELAVRVAATSNGIRTAFDLLQELGLIDYQERRVRKIRLFEVVILGTCKEENDADEDENICSGEQNCAKDEAVSAQNCAKSGGSFGTQQRKKKETKEVVSPHTPFLQERKDKKKENSKKQKNKKTNSSISEKPDGDGSAEGVNASQTPLGGQTQNAAPARELRPLTERRKEFYAQIQTFADIFDEDIRDSFYADWIEVNHETGLMKFEEKENFELKVALFKWSVNRKKIFQNKRGGNGGGGGARRGSVAQEISAERAQQQQRAREQEAVAKQENEYNRLKGDLTYVPREFYMLLRDEGKNAGAMTAEEIFTIISQRRASKTLKPEHMPTFDKWQASRLHAAEALQRMEESRQQAA